jgi:nucleotide-binding universal stress UspA family protein
LFQAACRLPTGSPFKIHKILVLIDFSDCAKKALQYALPLAREHEASITLLYVVTPPSYPLGEFGGMEYAGLLPDLKVGGEKELSAFADAEIHGEVPVDKIVSTGAPSVEIVDAAKRLDSDIIVISTHGRTGLKHVLLGSVAEHVIRSAPCPVLVVREREHEILATTPK